MKLAIIRFVIWAFFMACFLIGISLIQSEQHLIGYFLLGVWAGFITRVAVDQVFLEIKIKSHGY